MGANVPETPTAVARTGTPWAAHKAAPWRGVREAEAEDVRLEVGVIVAVGVPVWLVELVPVCDGVGVSVDVADGVCILVDELVRPAVLEAVRVFDVLEAVPEADGVALAVSESVAEPVWEGLAVPVPLDEPVSLLDALPVPVALPDDEPVPVALLVAVMVAVMEAVMEAVMVAVPVLVALLESVSIELLLPVPECELDAVPAAGADVASAVRSGLGAVGTPHASTTRPAKLGRPAFPPYTDSEDWAGAPPIRPLKL